MHGMHEVRGSIPLSSTKSEGSLRKQRAFFVFPPPRVDPAKPQNPPTEERFAFLHAHDKAARRARGCVIFGAPGVEKENCVFSARERIEKREWGASEANLGSLAIG